MYFVLSELAVYCFISQEMEAANECEKKELESKLGQVIHSQAGKLATERREFSLLQHKLQNQLVTYQRTCAQQQEEITTLRGIVGALEKMRNGMGATEGEVAEMQSVLEAWQAQAMEAQKELTHVHEKYRVLNAKHVEDQDRLQHLQHSLATAEENWNAEREQAKKADVDAAGLQQMLAKIEKVTQDAEHWRDAHRKLQASHEMEVEDGASWQKRAKYLEQLVSSFKSRIGELETQHLDTQQLNAKLAADVELLVGQHDHEHNQVQRLGEDFKHERESLGERLGTLERECECRVGMLANEHETRMHALQNINWDAQNSQASLLAQLQRLHADLERMGQDAEQVVSEKIAIAQKWQQQAERSQRELDSAESKTTVLQRENTALAEALRAQDRRRALLEEQQTDQENLRGKADAMTDELKVKEARICELESILQVRDY